MRDLIKSLSAEKHVLIAGPTASGKSAMALQIAETQGGVIVNADALQVFDGWRVLTARPSVEEEARARHALYGHVPYDANYSVGDWIKDITPLLSERLIIVGGTGLYFRALLDGLAEIPEIPASFRDEASARLERDGLSSLIAEIDPETAARIDLQNPRRVARAWEVEHATGTALHIWQDQTPAPLLPIENTTPLVLDAPKDWLTPRIEKRFQLMIKGGALGEARANLSRWSPDHASSKAIGARELIASLKGELSIDEATHQACIATRQFAKRQRTWFKARMSNWQHVDATAP